ncbi:dynein heavy chain and region D6 of dynein motor-domain-containing protein [Baffinella frigidus]|nr:dynein heavy chain and region D6 of dynein motor-domain-containing protein [Cryptophyta sp. CCMP2293]
MFTVYYEQDSEPSQDLAVRLKNLDDFFTYFLYKMVCRSLFEKDKLLFSFLLCTRIMRADSQLTDNELKFLVTVPSGIPQPLNLKPPTRKPSTPEPSTLNLQPSTLNPQPSTLNPQPSTLNPQPQHVFESGEPYKETFPGKWAECTPFVRLLIMRCIRPDKIVPAVMMFVSGEMGQRFVEPPPFDLAACFEDSSPVAPLIFILSPGADPNASLFKLADEKGFGETMKIVSLGQGQGPIAAKYVDDAYKEGGWVVLQNCHVYGSWMVSLERLCEEFKVETAHKNFRLWLTSYPSPVFPVSILQNGIKMTNEPAKGIRLNVKGSLLADPIGNQEFFSSCAKPTKWFKLVFALSFFHAVLQERRSFGPLGWNIAYGFTAGDMEISIRQTKMMLDEYDADQFKSLNYLIGECNYGGRVTDDKDRRYLLCCLADFYNVLMFDDAYKLSPSGVYMAPPGTPNYEEMVEHTLKLPLTQNPEVFGLHENADITKDQQETNYFCDTVLDTEAQDHSRRPTTSAIPSSTLKPRDILSRVPFEFDREKMFKKYPIRFDESMNTVLAQETIRYNALIAAIRTSLASLRKALQGLVVMSADLDGVLSALKTNKVPLLWSKKSYPSLKPLGGYITDLIARHTPHPKPLTNPKP